MKSIKLLYIAIAGIFSVTFHISPVWAADGATLIFKSGQVIYIDGGYQVLSNAMLALNKKDNLHNSTIQLTLEGSSFVVNVADINILCRDRCKNIELLDFNNSDVATTTINQNTEYRRHRHGKSR